jgi:N-methylhydantoinase A/oxoprolinase/acetone carboxylase beta subunit
MRTKYRLGIDAGGTFTDLVLADQSGDVRLYKALSTPADPTRAIEEGMKLIADDLGESSAKIVANSIDAAGRAGLRPYLFYRPNYCFFFFFFA